MSRRGLGIILPKAGWTKLMLPVMLCALPMAELTGAWLTVYASLWGATLFSIIGLWFWRFSKAQDDQIKSAMQKTDVNG